VQNKTMISLTQFNKQTRQVH